MGEKRISLPWADRIRARLEEIQPDGYVPTKYKEVIVIQEFLKPILEYAESEEKRITNEFRKKEIIKRAKRAVEVGIEQ